MLEISVVVPARNAEHLIGDCLESIRRANPREIIVVDGLSTDRTREIAEAQGATVLSDDGRGLPVARLLGAEAASAPWVALVDADVVVPERGLERLFAEFREGGYTALQAGLESVSGRGYWGRALAAHHRSGVSKRWFGLVATIFDRNALLAHGFDEAFQSGEDIDLRWRLRRAGAKIGVSERTVFTHRFDDTFDFARGQWLADGRGLGRMLGRHGPKALLLWALPSAAAVRGILVSVWRREPHWIPYYACFAVFNYVGMVSGVGERFKRRRPGLTGRSVRN